jgi:hypothetical protein
MQVIKQSVQIKLDTEEIKTLRRASEILGGICENYRENVGACEGCPLHGVCTIENGAPQDVVYQALVAMVEQ